MLSHVDLRSTARVRVCREFLVEILEEPRDLVEGLKSRYFSGVTVFQGIGIKLLIYSSIQV